MVAKAFIKDVPKPEKDLFAARTPHDILSKIPMPRSEDHGWGQHIATFEFQTPRTTPFNSRLKGDPNSQFKAPVGKVGLSSSKKEEEVSPRTEFATRVKRIIDYLNTLNLQYDPNPDMLRNE